MDVEEQRDPRIRRRVPCRVTVPGGSTAAMVLNVSRRGLFVQTGAFAKPGEEVTVHLSPAHTPDPIEIEAQVVWRRSVASHLRTIAKGGMGLEIRNPPASYLDFLTDAPQPARPPRAAAKPDDTPTATFLLRVRQVGGPRTRKLYVQAGDESAAQARTLQRFGPGWNVLEIEKL